MAKTDRDCLWSRWSMRRVVAVGLVVAAVVGAATRALAGDASGTAAPFYRLVDHAESSHRHGTMIDGVQKRILDPYPGEHAFLLENPPEKARLAFSLGLRPLDAGGTVRFEAELWSPEGEATSVYRRDVSESGWLDQTVDLSEHDLAGKRLVLRRSLVAGPVQRVFQAAWGDPVLIPGETARARYPSVILVSLDTLRADRVGAYGDAAARTPVLDGLARRGVTFDNAYSPSTWTLPSHASLFTGRHLPSLPRPLGNGETPSRIRTLPEMFREAGYLTAGFTGGGFVSGNFGFPRGFDTYSMFEQPPGSMENCTEERFDGPQVFERAERWIRERSNAPFFLFVHTYDIHDNCAFRDDEHPMAAWRDLGPEELKRLKSHYDDLVARTDQRLGRLLDVLRAQGQLDSTLIVLTSDHGEAFEEHGGKGHGCEVVPYEELVRVPLIFHHPDGLQPRRVDTPVSLIDVAPSILALSKAPSDPGMQGHVLPGLGLDAPAAPVPVFVHCGDLLAVRSGDHKLITVRDGSRPDEIYDLRSDPGETRNLAAEGAAPAAEPAEIAELEQLATGFWAAVAPPVGEEAPLETLDEKTRERLRALGYIE